jgi:hypothetical protein
MGVTTNIKEECAVFTLEKHKTLFCRSAVLRMTVLLLAIAIIAPQPPVFPREIRRSICDKD